MRAGPPPIPSTNAACGRCGGRGRECLAAGSMGSNQCTSTPRRCDVTRTPPSLRPHLALHEVRLHATSEVEQVLPCVRTRVEGGNTGRSGGCGKKTAAARGSLRHVRHGPRTRCTHSCSRRLRPWLRRARYTGAQRGAGGDRCGPLRSLVFGCEEPGPTAEQLGARTSGFQAASPS